MECKRVCRSGAPVVHMCFQHSVIFPNWVATRSLLARGDDCPFEQVLDVLCPATEELDMARRGGRALGMASAGASKNSAPKSPGQVLRVRSLEKGRASAQLLALTPLPRNAGLCRNAHGR